VSEPVSTVRNLGPASEGLFARAGITSAEQLRELGADAAYLRVLAAGIRPHFIGYYALVMGLQGRPWNDCQGQEKTDLRVKFDQLKAEMTQTEKGHLEIEAALDKIGVVKRNR